MPWLKCCFVITIVRDYYGRLQIVFKENSGLPVDIEFTREAFSSMFPNGLDSDLSLLVKRTYIVFTLDLVKLASRVAHTREGDSKRAT